MAVEENVKILKNLIEKGKRFAIFERTYSGSYAGILYIYSPETKQLERINGDPEELYNLEKELVNHNCEKLIYIDNSEFRTKNDEEWLEALKQVFPSHFG